VSGSLLSFPFGRFRLDFYASAAADPSGFGEGQRYVGSGVVTTGVLGSASFNFNFGFLQLPGFQITATATVLAGGTGVATSEFSRAVAARVIPIGDPIPLSFTTGALRSADETPLEEIVSSR
jgi:hypothetical protein